MPAAARVYADIFIMPLHYAIDAAMPYYAAGLLRYTIYHAFA